MRVTTLLRRLIGVCALFVGEASFDEKGDLRVAVRPRWRRPRCGSCGKKAAGYDRRPLRSWQHLALGGTRIFLEYSPRRVCCIRCGVKTEQVPWAKPGSRFTEAFEEMVAYLSQVTDRTKVRELTGISWTTVGSIIERVVQGRLDPDRLQGLRRIGIDEFSYRKRHRYITVIVDHQRRRVVWAAEGRTAKVLGEFFKLLGEEGRASIDSVTIDMAGSYKKAIREWIPHATVIYDRFHVQRLASKAVDEVRRAMARDLRGLDEEQRKTIKNTRYVLLKNPWHLTPIEQQRLAEVQRTNKKLYRAYLLKETLAHALDYRQPARARRALEEWLAWASRSRLKPFVRLARTLRQHREGVLAYVKNRLTNGIVEGINTKLRMVARRAFGFHSADALIAMLFLIAGGVKLNPPLPTRT